MIGGKVLDPSALAEYVQGSIATDAWLATARATGAPKVAKPLAESGAWDGTAGHVVLVARQRGWPVLTADPDRLRRIAPDVDVDEL